MSRSPAAPFSCAYGTFRWLTYGSLHPAVARSPTASATAARIAHPHTPDDSHIRGSLWRNKEAREFQHIFRWLLTSGAPLVNPRSRSPACHAPSGRVEGASEPRPSHVRVRARALESVRTGVGNAPVGLDAPIRGTGRHDSNGSAEAEEAKGLGASPEALRRVG